MFLTRGQRFFVLVYLSWIAVIPLATLAFVFSRTVWGAALLAAILGWTALIVLVWLRGRRRPHVL